MNNDMNNQSERDPVMESMLERLSSHDRSEPDAGFEDRVWHAMQQQHTARVPGRRRKKSTAWIPFATAACIALLGYVVWMPMLSVDVESVNEVASAEPESDLSTDLLLSSFDAMDMLIADADEIDESLNMLELQIDTNEYELSSDSAWQDLGGSL